jgi:integrase
MIYRRGKKGTYSYRFRFDGRIYHESTKTKSATIARDAERQRRRGLELSINGLKERRALPPMFKVAAKKWQDNREHIVAAKTQAIASNALKRLLPVFGDKLLSDIGYQDIVDYQKKRQAYGAKNRTINIEVGLLRQVLLDYDESLWLPLARKVPSLRENKDVGRAISPEQQEALLKAAAEPRYSDSPLHPIVVLGLSTAMRSTEIKTLRWSQVDLLDKTLTVGKSKTEQGSGRVIPLTQAAVAVLVKWATRTPEARPEHFIFAACENHHVDPSRPITSFRTAWRNATKTAGLEGLRFHDLRHTAITKLAESQASESTVMSIAGHVSRKMMERYSHIRTNAKRTAVEALNLPGFEGVHQNVHQVSENEKAPTAKLLN